MYQRGQHAEMWGLPTPKGRRTGPSSATARANRDPSARCPYIPDTGRDGRVVSRPRDRVREQGDPLSLLELLPFAAGSVTQTPVHSNRCGGAPCSRLPKGSSGRRPGRSASGLRSRRPVTSRTQPSAPIFVSRRRLCTGGGRPVLAHRRRAGAGSLPRTDDQKGAEKRHAGTGA